MIKAYENQTDWSKADQATPEIKERLEVLRQSLQDEDLSYGELAELQGLADYIEPGDVELLQAAGVPEYLEDE